MGDKKQRNSHGDKLGRKYKTQPLANSLRSNLGNGAINSEKWIYEPACLVNRVRYVACQKKNHAKWIREFVCHFVSHKNYRGGCSRLRKFELRDKFQKIRGACNSCA